MRHDVHTAAEHANRWPFRLAIVLAGVTFPLIWVGGLVTSYDAGMAVPDWPTTFGYNMFLYPWQSWFFGPWDLFVEHGHRLLGSLAGLLSIALVAVSTRAGTPRRVALAAWGLLLLVILQGVLGGLRVRMNSRVLAQVHGMVGPLFFASVVSFAIWSRRATRGSGSTLDRPWSVWATSWMLFVLLLMQLLLGSQLRHVDGMMSGEVFRWSAVFHVGMAMVLVASSVQLTWMTRHEPGLTGRLARLGTGLFAAQVILGAVTWLQRYGWPLGLFPNTPLPGWVVESEGLWQSLSATAHVAVGALILAVYAALVVSSGALRGWTRWPSGREALA